MVSHANLDFAKSQRRAYTLRYEHPTPLERLFYIFIYKLILKGRFEDQCFFLIQTWRSVWHHFLKHRRTIFKALTIIIYTFLSMKLKSRRDGIIIENSIAMK